MNATCRESGSSQASNPLGGRIFSLDGLRAISIILVIVGHLCKTQSFTTSNSGIGDCAHLGVVIFFVISGFLITALLISEKEVTGRVSLKLFYARRFLRIFPVFYAYLAAALLLWRVGLIHLTVTDMWHALTYTVNFLPDRSWYIGHLWSLSVEEQFYLLWPCAFVAFGSRKASWAAAGVLVVAIVARIANRLFLIGTPYHDLEMFPMVADSLAVGCLLARSRGWLEKQDWYVRLLQTDCALLILALVLLLNRLQGYSLGSIFGASMINIGLALLIHRSVYHANDLMGRLLNWKPVAFLGVLSYSLYLWQQFFLNPHSGAWVNTFPQNLLCIFGVSLVSYFVIEKPLLRLRHHLHAPSAAPEASVDAKVLDGFNSDANSATSALASPSSK